MDFVAKSLHIEVFLALTLDKTKAVDWFYVSLGLFSTLGAWRKVHPVRVAYNLIDCRPMEFEISFSEANFFSFQNGFCGEIPSYRSFSCINT